MSPAKDLISPISQKRISSFLNRPSHALLLLGPGGSGKLDVAKQLAWRLLGLASAESLAKYPYYLHVTREPKKQDISIETIRSITRFLRNKTTGTNQIRRVILIEDAHYLSSQAQNALLKVLEEPGSDTVFVLTAPSSRSLLSTIVSRCQQITLNSIGRAQAAHYFGDQYPAKEIDSAWQISQGQPVLMEQLLRQDTVHPLKNAVDQAKVFLKNDSYARLLMVEEISRDKDQINTFLEALEMVLAALHHNSILAEKKEQAGRILKARELVLKTLSETETNANMRLQNLKLVLNLKV